MKKHLLKIITILIIVIMILAVFWLKKPGQTVMLKTIAKESTQVTSKAETIIKQNTKIKTLSTKQESISPKKDYQTEVYRL